MQPETARKKFYHLIVDISLMGSSVLLLRHHLKQRSIYNEIVMKHLGTDTYMVPLLAPVQHRLDWIWVATVSGIVVATAERSRRKDGLSLCTLIVVGSAGVAIALLGP